MATYEKLIPIRFGHLDPAGILYYPRYFHYLHVAFEEFFGACAGVTYPDLLGVRKIGFPVVHAEADYRKGFVYGDVMRIEMAIVRVGHASMTFRYRARTADSDEVRAEAKVTTACVHMDDFRPMPIPDDLREAFERYRAED